MKMILAATVATMMGAGAAAAETVCGAQTHQRFGETRAYFRDVLSACRPDGYCSAVMTVGAGEDGFTYRQQMRVARPTPGAPYQVEFVGVDPMPADDPGPMALSFAGTAFDFTAHHARTESVNEYRVSDQAMSDAIVGQLKKARTARWTYASASGPATGAFALNGVTAALDWIDCMGAGRQ
ncbi:MAG: hypothetical protein NW200_14805 [Hyphomonadaceae bacterium]|nr:hypothetical protein [Hyphomonadaceae bacterium]